MRKQCKEADTDRDICERWYSPVDFEFRVTPEKLRQVNRFSAPGAVFPVTYVRSEMAEEQNE